MCQPGIARDQSDAFDHALCDQAPIEEAPMERWQAVHRQDMCSTDGQLDVTLIQKTAAQQARVRPEVRTAQSVFDDDLQRLATL